MRVAVALAFISLTGCSGLFNIENGYAHAIAKSPDQAALAINANLGFGPGGDTWGAGFGINGRSKFGHNVQQVATGPFAYCAFGSMTGKFPYSFYALGGFHLLQVDNVYTLGVGNQFSFGAGSPVAQVGVSLPAFLLTFAVGAEYDVRFSSVPNTGYLSFLLGFGGVGFGKL